MSAYQGIRARRIVPAPGYMVDDALLVMRDGMVTALGPWREIKNRYSGPVRDVAGTVVPAPINCHTHLECSHLRGATVLGQGFTAWVRSLLRNDLFGCTQADLDSAVEEMRLCGTGLAADVCSRKPREVADAMRRGGVGLLLQSEAMGFAPPRFEEYVLSEEFHILMTEGLVDVAAAGHALYSTHSELLREARAWSLEQGRPFSLHLAEHQEEVELLATGGGDFADLLRERILPRNYRAPGLSPVRYAHQLGLLGPGTLAVHCVHVDRDDVRLLAKTGTTVCLCPRSNAAIGVGQAPVDFFLDSGVRLCLGTDSLASNSDLNIWKELRTLLVRTPLPFEQALAMLTTDAAAALGVQNQWGSLDLGKRAAWTVLPDFIEALC
jgi:aminodeoxyfutalosine deaminase